MSILIMTAQLLLALTILVFVHELGHFLAAKAFKTKVDKFYLFFDFLFPLPNVMNFALWKKKIGETEYGFGWFPLGGYVSIAGMVDETQDADAMAKEPEPWEYRSKRSWQKMIIILAGIIFNLVFAAIIYAGLFKFHDKEYLPAEQLNSGGVYVSETAESLGFKNGDVILTVNGETPERFEDLVPMSILFGGEYEVKRNENGNEVKKTITIPGDYYKRFDKGMFIPFYQNLSVDLVTSSSLAEKAGLKAGDKIIEANGIPITHFDLFKSILDSNKSGTVDITIERDKKQLNLKSEVGENGLIGFRPGFKFPEGRYQMKKYGVLQSLKHGTNECFRLFTLQIVNIAKIFRGEIEAKNSLGGPVAMAQGFGSEWNWYRFWLFTAMISVGLAFANLLPIPALDGGHAIIILIEAIIRRPLPVKALEILQTIGTYLILALMIYVFYIDLNR